METATVGVGIGLSIDGRAAAKMGQIFVTERGQVRGQVAVSVFAQAQVWKPMMPICSALVAWEGAVVLLYDKEEGMTKGPCKHK